MRKILGLLIVLLIFTTCMKLFNTNVYACSCVSGNALEKLQRSHAVFSGRVIEVGKSKNGDTGKLRKYTFEVDKAWKGELTQKTSIYSYDGAEASCGYKFRQNDSYLVYSYLGTNGDLETNFCSGNMEYLKANSEMNLLGQEIVVKKEIGIDNEKGEKVRWIVIYSIGFLILLALMIWRIRNTKQ